MKTLIIGGTGPIGASIALHLLGLGYTITISSRNPPDNRGPLSDIPWVKSNYLDESFTEADLEEYEAIVFAAGSDVRHVPENDNADDHFLLANGVMVPKFAALAKKAGVKTFIHIGSFYPHVLPEMIDSDAYVRSRHLAAKGVTDLAAKDFRAISIDAPFVVGMPKGMKNDMFMAYLAYGKGWHPNVEPFGPAGGTNFISVRSLAQATASAIGRGKPGSVYLVGDENLSFAKFFEHFFRAVGNDVAVPSLDQEHPFLPDIAITQGRGNFIEYEPDEDVTDILKYDRNDIFPMIQSMAQDVDAMIGEIEPIYIGSDAVFDSTLFALACQYAHAVDAGDGDLLRSICTEDIVLRAPIFITQGGDDVAAIPELLKMYFASTRHTVSQQLVSITGDTAVGQTLCSAEHLMHVEPDASHREVLKWAVRYQDRFQRINGSWLFSQRDIIVDWMELTQVHIPV